MIDASTRDTINGWMYSSAAPTAVSAPQAPAAASTSGGMIATATAQPTAYSPAPSYYTRENGYDVGALPSTIGQPSATWAGLAASTIAPTDLTHRTIDPAKETVNGQMQTLMSENSPLLQQAKADAMRSANERGMLNSTMAASGGTDAMLRSALNVATPDAAYYNHAADYNAAADNQAVMYNADQNNQTNRLQAQLAADQATREQQKYLAEMQDATSRYNTDSTYRNQVEANKKTLVNNIINNMEFSPDRKAAMLQELGEGQTASYLPDGTYFPGSGLAGAIYVISSVSADLNNSRASADIQPAGSSGISDTMSREIQLARESSMSNMEMQDRAQWGSGQMYERSDPYSYYY